MNCAGIAFDPTTGHFTTIGTYPDTVTKQFVSPPAHEGGNDDWVLLLRAG